MISISSEKTTDRNDVFTDLRQYEFSRLDKLNHIYLDYTGSAVYPASLVEKHAEHLQQSVLGNPHSNNPTSTLSSTLFETAKNKVLDFFCADPNQYEVIFTANATMAIKLVAESFPFQSSSRLLLTSDNHNSINGIREYAAIQKADITYLPLDKTLSLNTIDATLDRLGPISGPSLFAYPAQSNFSGAQHSLDHIQTAQALGYRVLLDAAAFAPGNDLNLSRVSPDFVCVSFYKMFGYPTGIGALIARKSSLRQLDRPWFSGGTVDYASTQHRLHQLSSGATAYEDGTVNFTATQAVTNGLNFLQSIGMDAIHNHLNKLGRLLVTELQTLRHANGVPLIRLYGGDVLTYGSARAFNVINDQGEVVCYENIEREASHAGISIRGGCFCNPGCAETALDLPTESMERCLQAANNLPFSYKRLAHCLERSSVGALRVSWGIANNKQDIWQFIRFMKNIASKFCTPHGRYEKADQQSL